MVPAVRTLISVPAGITRMHCVPFFICSGLGTLAWTGLLTGAGYLLEGQYERVAHWIDPLSTLVVGGIAGVYLYRVARRWPR